jgi:hypothetical protein
MKLFYFSAIDCDVDNFSSHKQFPGSNFATYNKVLRKEGK